MPAVVDALRVHDQEPLTVGDLAQTGQARHILAVAAGAMKSEQQRRGYRRLVPPRHVHTVGPANTVDHQRVLGVRSALRRRTATRMQHDDQDQCSGQKAPPVGNPEGIHTRSSTSQAAAWPSWPPWPGWGWKASPPRTTDGADDLPLPSELMSRILAESRRPQTPGCKAPDPAIAFTWSSITISNRAKEPVSYTGPPCRPCIGGMNSLSLGVSRSRSAEARSPRRRSRAGRSGKAAVARPRWSCASIWWTSCP